MDNTAMCGTIYTTYRQSLNGLRLRRTVRSLFQFYDKYKEYMAAFGASSAEMTNQALIAYANASTSGNTPISADIKDKLQHSVQA